MQDRVEMLPLIPFIQSLQRSGVIIVACPLNAETTAAPNNGSKKIGATVKLCPELYTACCVWG
jgi:hypothetical protein